MKAASGIVRAAFSPQSQLKLQSEISFFPENEIYKHTEAFDNITMQSSIKGLLAD